MTTDTNTTTDTTTEWEDLVEVEARAREAWFLAEATGMPPEIVEDLLVDLVAAESAIDEYLAHD